MEATVFSSSAKSSCTFTSGILIVLEVATDEALGEKYFTKAKLSKTPKAQQAIE